MCIFNDIINEKLRRKQEERAQRMIAQQKNEEPKTQTDHANKREIHMNPTKSITPVNIRLLIAPRTENNEPSYTEIDEVVVEEWTPSGMYVRLRSLTKHYQAAKWYPKNSLFVLETFGTYVPQPNKEIITGLSSPWPR